MSLKINSGSSDNYGVVVERYPSRPVPARRYTAYQIPGRSGDLIFTEDAFNSVEQSYEIYIKGTGGLTFQQACVKAASWLMGNGGNVRIEDSYDPAVYRRGVFVGPMDIANVLNQFGRATVTYYCQPWRYISSGTNAIEITSSPYTLTNPTTGTYGAYYKCEPEITVYGSGAGQVKVGSYTVDISAIDDGMTIDSETMNTYNNLNNDNHLVTFSPTYTYPTLDSTSTIVKFSGGVTKLEIVPNWRII